MENSSTDTIKRETEETVFTIINSLSDEQRQNLLDNFDSLRDALTEKLGTKKG